MSSCREMKINVKRRLYEGVVVPTALLGDETLSMGVAEKKLIVMERRCLRSMCGVTQMYLVWNEEVRKRTGVKRELVILAEQSEWRWS